MPLKTAPVWALLGPKAQRPDSWGVRTDVTNLATTGVTKMYIYGEIGYWGVEASDVVEALQGISGPVEVHINSMGGSVFEGLAIYQALVEHSAGVDVVIDGLAASAASFIAMAGRTIQIGAAAHMMIHNASSGCYGTAADMEATAAMLRNCSAAIAGLYAKRSGQPVEGFTAAMDAETWYIGQEAVDAGLADSVRGDDGEDEPLIPAENTYVGPDGLLAIGFQLDQLADPPVCRQGNDSPDEIEGERERERPIETDGNTPNGETAEDSSPSEEGDTPGIWDHLTEIGLFDHLEAVPAGLFDHLTEGAAQ